MFAGAITRGPGATTRTRYSTAAGYTTPFDRRESTVKLDDYRLLGQSGLRVSPLCLGAMTFGDEGGRSAGPEVSGQMMKRYAEQGGNFIDTANIYSYGRSEDLVGDFIASR